MFSNNSHGKNSTSRKNNKPLSSESDSVEVYDDDEATLPIPEEIIYPGLVLKNEYVLLKKIGFGNNAAVWMTYQISTQSYFAIKIQDNQCYNDGCREVAIIKKINSYCKENNTKNICIVKMLDFFVYEEDDETKYVCSVYDLYAGSIQMLLCEGKYKYGLPIPVVKNIIRQLLIALSTLHMDLSVIHTDIKPENILFKGIPEYQTRIIESFEKTNFQKKYDVILQRYKGNDSKFTDELECLAIESVYELDTIDTSFTGCEEFHPDDENLDEDDFIEGDDDNEYDYDSSDSSDNQCIFNERDQSVNDAIENLDYSKMHDLDIEVDYDFKSVLNNRENSQDKKEMIDDKYVKNCQVALTDFGNSYFFSKRTKNEVQDRRYRAPEIILDFNYKYACDIWSVSCVTFELLTGFALFEPDTHPLNKDIQHLYLMEKNLGKIPLVMKKASKRSKFLFDKKRNYHIKNLEPFSSCPLKNRLVNQFLFTDTDAEDIYDFIIQGLHYDPTERPNAIEMLAHPWLKEFKY